MGISCMGGFCGRREACAIYQAKDRRHPAERLCETGRSDAFEPIPVTRPAGTWERGAGALLRPAIWLDAVVPA